METPKTTLTFQREPELNDQPPPYRTIVIGSGNAAETEKVSPALSAIQEYDTIEYTKNTVSIGSEVTISSLTKSEIIRAKFPVLVQAVFLTGFQLLRNGNTIGGTLIADGSDGDIPSALMAYKAWVKLDGATDTRIMTLNDFFTAPGKTAMLPDEVLTEIIVDIPPPHTGTDYLKQYHRSTRDIVLASVASRVTLDKPDGVILDAQIIIRTTTPKARHARNAEKTLIGKYPSEALFIDAARRAAEEMIPSASANGTSSYRKSVITALTRRTLWKAVDQIKP